MLVGWFVRAQIADTLSIHFSDITLERALDSITYKTDYFFSYNAAAIPNGSLYSISKEAVGVRELLDELLVGTDLEYQILGDQIILKKSVESGLFFRNEAKRRTSIKGWVRVKDSNEILGGANVFIDGTTIGTVTGSNGEYILEKIPEGSHQLVFSHIGYSTHSYAIRVERGSAYVVNAHLDQQATELDSVEVTSLPYVDSKYWLKYFNAFEKEFIGYSRNSAYTKITNREVLDFTYDTQRDILKVYAEKPLEIINNALGYKVNCQLEYFEKNKHITNFHIKMRFQNLQHSGRKERRKWEKNRKNAYNGSSAHFFKSIIKGSYAKEGFRIYRENQENRIVPVHRSDILNESEDGLYWKLSFTGPIFIQYTKELESAEYLNSLSGYEGGSNGSSTPGFQQSELELKVNEVILFKNGQIRKPENVIKKGYWSWERVADLMPIDYGLKR